MVCTCVINSMAENTCFCEKNVIFLESHVYTKKFIILTNKRG